MLKSIVLSLFGAGFALACLAMVPNPALVPLSPAAAATFACAQCEMCTHWGCGGGPPGHPCEVIVQGFMPYSDGTLYGTPSLIRWCNTGSDPVEECNWVYLNITQCN